MHGVNLDLMKGLFDSPGWLIVAALFILFDIVVPMLKKRKKKRAMEQQLQQQPTHQPPAQYEPPPAVPRAPAPTPRPDPQRMPRPAATRPAATATAPRKTAPDGPTDQELLGNMLQPLTDLQLVRTTLERNNVYGAFANAVAQAEYPLNLPDGFQLLSAALHNALPAFGGETHAAAQLPTQQSEINSVEELVQESQLLAPGWLEALVADAIGCALMGPGYAYLRVRRLAMLGQVDALALNVATGMGLRLDPPLVIVAPALIVALRELGHTRAVPAFREYAVKAVNKRSSMKLTLHGMGRPVEFEVPVSRAVQTTEEMMLGLVRSPYATLDGKTMGDFAADARVTDAWLRADDLVKAWKAGRDPEVGSLARLQGHALLAATFGPDKARKVLAAARQGVSLFQRRKAERTAESDVLPMTHLAIVEGMVLGQLLQRHGRR